MPQMDPCAVVCVRARVLGLLEMLAAPCSRWGPAGDLALRDVGFGCAGGLWTTLSSTVETGVQAGALEAVMNAASPRLSVTPSFPKAAYDGSGHAEIRAGIRLLSTGAGIGDAARPAANGDDGGAVSVKLGLGINTGAGIKDNSVGFKALGCGLQLGQRTGISFFDNEVVIDFKRLFGGRSEPIAEEEESDQAYELGLMDCITPSRSESRTTSGIPALTDAGSPHVRI